MNRDRSYEEIVLTKIDERFDEIAQLIEERLPARKRSKVKAEPDAQPDPRASEILAKWNELAECHKLSRISTISPKRAKGIKARLAEGMDLNQVFQEIRRSQFLQGKNDRNWKVTFDFIFLSPNNWPKVIEGKYRDKQQAGPTHQPRNTEIADW